MGAARHTESGVGISREIMGRIKPKRRTFTFLFLHATHPPLLFLWVFFFLGSAWAESTNLRGSVHSASGEVYEVNAGMMQMMQRDDLGMCVLMPPLRDFLQVPVHDGWIRSPEPGG